MITCIKHKTEFVGGECPRCKELKKGISVSYKSSNPVHESDFMMDKINELNMYSNKLKELNIKLKKLLEINKESK